MCYIMFFTFAYVLQDDLMAKPKELTPLIEELTQLVNQKDGLIEQQKEEQIKLQELVEAPQREIKNMRENYAAKQKPSIFSNVFNQCDKIFTFVIHKHVIQIFTIKI